MVDMRDLRKKELERLWPPHRTSHEGRKFLDNDVSNGRSPRMMNVLVRISIILRNLFARKGR